MKKGFTIVELIMVIAIIGILLGIITTAASSSIKQARVRKADACCTIVQQGIATYYAQKAKWPGSIGERIYSGSINSRTNDEGTNGQSDPDRYILDATEIDSMMRSMIDETKRGNPMMDISGLYVSRKVGEARWDSKGNDIGDKCYGLDFMDAVRGTKRSKKKMKVAEMHFGYPEKEHGYFRHFKIIYSIPTDEMKVSKQ